VVDKAHRKVILAASLGTVFEWYDFYLYGSLAAIISRQFFSGVNETTAFIFALMAFAAGFAVRPFGALVLLNGHKAVEGDALVAWYGFLFLDAAHQPRNVHAGQVRPFDCVAVLVKDGQIHLGDLEVLGRWHFSVLHLLALKLDGLRTRIQLALVLCVQSALQCRRSP
jgi:hypothetical protein